MEVFPKEYVDEQKVLSNDQFCNQDYVVITPVRNEAKFIEKVLDSMILQTKQPIEWIIVDDGSTDDTPQIVNRYAERYFWIKLVNKQDRGFRQRGKGVIQAFYAGYNTLSAANYHFIVKLDGDLSFNPTYFESLLSEFKTSPKLGIAGGGIYEMSDGVSWVLTSVRDVVRGATKMYRRECFETIGGLYSAPGWDGIDEWKALANGWDVRSFPKLKVYHYRPMGSATGALISRKEEGLGAYYMGYHPLYIIARSLRHIFTRPYLFGGMAMVFTYFVSFLQGREKIANPDLIRYIRKTQLRKLSGLLKGIPVYKK
jgi:glycosyltransferase involved in cell wall biosynthesis